METSYALQRLGTVATVRSGYAFKSKDWADVGIPVIKIANVKDGSLTLDGCSYVSDAIAEQAADFEIRRGDILISMTGNVGDIALIRTDRRLLLNQRVGRFEITAPKVLDPMFLYYFLRHPEVRAKIGGLGYGSVQANISPALILSVDIPLPSLVEQRAIAAILGALDDKIELNRRMNRTLEAMAQALFQSWFVNFDPVRAKMAGRQPAGMDAETAALFPSLMQTSDLGEYPLGWQAPPFQEVFDINPPRQLRQGALSPYLEMSNLPTSAARVAA